MPCVSAYPKCPEEHEGALPMLEVLATEQVSNYGKMRLWDCISGHAVGSDAKS